MEWKFILVDRYNNKTVIDEPIGWDTFSIRIKRHPTRHGTFRELQGNTFQFFGKGAALLKAEYDQYGLRGNYRMIIKWKCSAGWKEFYTGSISFDTYSFTCGPSCFVTADIEQTGPVVSFINRFDQKVEVGNNIAFDKITALTDYPLLTKNLTLPSKAILLRSQAKTTEQKEYVVSGDSGWFFPSGTGQLQGSLSIPLDNVTVSSIRDFTTSTITDFYNYTHSQEYVPELIYNNPDQGQSIKCVGNIFNIDLRVKGKWRHLVAGSGNMALAFIVRKGPTQFVAGVGNVDIFTHFVIGSLAGGEALSTLATERPFDLTFTGPVTLLPGEKLWVDFYLTYFKATNFIANDRLVIDPETFFKASVESKCDPTESKVYLINETASRITEAITDNKMKVYSEYLGRPDSLPYSFDNNGCGALRSLALGLDIRREKLPDGSDPKMFLSMEDIFNHLSATDNIGIGVEGTDKIRIENWKWFYQSTVIHRCLNIDKVRIAIKPDELYSLIKIGYEKWESEDFNGMDEILTRREYRTQITQLQNTIDILSKIVGSGYAIEVTRRKGPDDQDFQYDNDVFAICLDEDLEVEIGNIDNAANMVDPATVYNFRISPARMLMKWFDRLSAIYKNISNLDKMIFSKGEGNYVAEGELSGPFCKQEAGTLKENDDISFETFEDQDDAKPIMFGERATYQFPLGAGDFKKIMANPYGKILYQSDCETGHGWIDEVEYFPEMGSAKFNLMPEAVYPPSQSSSQQGIITEQGEFIRTEDEQNITTE